MCSFQFQVSMWFDTLFPDVSYPSNRLSAVLNRLVKKTEDLQKEGADLTSFLQEKIDFDFVSAALLKQGLKRGHLLNEVTWTPEPTNEPLTHEVVVDIENFRTKEKLAEKFTFQWIKTLSQSHTTDSDLLLKKSLKKLMECYRTLMKNKHKRVKPDMLSVFLSTPFQTVKQQPAVQLHSCTPSTSNEMTKKLKILGMKNAALLQEKLDLKEQNSVFMSTINDLSRDKRQLQIQLDEAIQLNIVVQQLQEESKQAKKLIRKMNPSNMRKLRKQLKTAKTNLRTAQNRLAGAQAQVHAQKKRSSKEQVKWLKIKKRV